MTRPLAKPRIGKTDMTYEEADELIRDHIDYGGSVDVHALAVAISVEAACDKAAGSRSLTLTGAQILEAFNYVAPDYPNDPDQLEHELTIQHFDGHSGEGMYCWFADYPDEGSMLLDGTPPAKLSTETVDKGVDRLTEARIDWIANAHCPGGIAYPSNVKNAIREALLAASESQGAEI